MLTLASSAMARVEPKADSRGCERSAPGHRREQQSTTRGPQRQHPRGTKAHVKSMRRRTAIIWLIWFVTVFSFYGFFTWIPTLLVQRGIEVTRSFDAMKGRGPPAPGGFPANAGGVISNTM